LKKAYACDLGLSRNNALMSGVRQKERFSLGALCPDGIIKGIPPQYDISYLPQYHLPELRGGRGRRGKLEGRCRVYSVKLIGNLRCEVRVTGLPAFSIAGFGFRGAGLIFLNLSLSYYNHYVSSTPSFNISK